MSQQTTLAAAITTVGQSSITITEYTGFPASGAFTILIDTEWLRVTAGNGTTTWTVTRGYGSTTAATHLISSTVTLIPDTLAQLGDLTPMLALGTDTTRHGMLSDILVSVTQDIHADCQRSFLQGATATFYADVRYGGKSSLLEAIGRPRFVDGRALDLVSVTTLEARDSETGSYTAIAAGDTGYYLDGWSTGVGIYGTDWAFEDIVLSIQATYPTWPVGKRAVKVTGIPGFPAVPPAVEWACLAEASERFRQRISGGAQPEGVNQFGTPMFLTGASSEMRRIRGEPYSLRRMVA